jgi:hypothetical protein
VLNTGRGTTGHSGEARVMHAVPLPAARCLYSIFFDSDIHGEQHAGLVSFSAFVVTKLSL